MNNAKRLVYGLLSSLLLAVGFVRAADRLDPISVDRAGTTEHQLKLAGDCTNACDAVIDQNYKLKLAWDCTNACDAVID